MEAGTTQREGCANVKRAQALSLARASGCLLDGAEKVRQCVEVRATFFWGAA